MANLTERPTGPFELRGEKIGRFVVTDQLGEGAMGVVVRAHDVSLDRDVAIKMIKRHLLSPSMISRFDREVQTIADCRHPNVIDIIEVGEHGGAPFLVTEYVPGPSLREWLDQTNKVNLRAAHTLLDGICRGVAAVHESGAIHRDLKPSNILIGPGFTPKLIDFGLSRPRGVTRRSSQQIALGTPSYMAPELSLQSSIEPRFENRADIYSLGLIAYELFSGSAPFEGDALQVIAQHTMAEPDPPSFRGAPDEVDVPILKALIKKPEARIKTVEAFRRAVARELAPLIRKGRPHVVIATQGDDEYRDTLKEIRPDLKLSFTSSGREVLGLVSEHEVDLVILDGMDGDLHALELVALLGSRSPLTMTAVVLDSPYEWERQLEIGADAFLVRPTTETRIAKICEQLLGI